MEVKMETQKNQNQVMSTQMQYHWLEGQQSPKKKKDIKNTRDRIKKRSGEITTKTMIFILLAGMSVFYFI
jgi:hypothetical protein